MLVIDLDKDFKFVDFLNGVIDEAAKFYHVDDKPRSQSNNYKLYDLPKKRFLRLVEVWALKTYSMYIRFNFIDDNVCNLIEVGFEDLSDEEIEYVVMNMYLEETNNEALR